MFDAPWHWVVLAIVVIALFGYKRLPDASRAVGRSLRIFKSELRGLNEDDKSREAREDSAASRELPPAVPPPVTPHPVQPQDGRQAAPQPPADRPAGSI
jgi:sec-independent protein translocase protein TatA